MLGRVSAAGAGGNGGKAGTAGGTVAVLTAAGIWETVDGAVVAAGLSGAGSWARTGTLTSRGSPGDSLVGVGTTFLGIDTVGRRAGGWGAGCGVALGCDQETS